MNKKFNYGFKSNSIQKRGTTYTQRFAAAAATCQSDAEMRKKR